MSRNTFLAIVLWIAALIAAANLLASNPNLGAHRDFAAYQVTVWPTS
jgi:hypothetical protein